MNLIPSENILTANYSCTWGLQEDAAKKLGITGVNQSEMRAVLTQENLFDTEEFYHPIPREYRSALFLLMDDGWDVPGATPNDKDHTAVFGSCEPDPVKFSRFGSTPTERLKGMNEAAKALGYAGLGLWISPQQSGETEYDPEAARLYWEERARRCHEAGVGYWKVDWGFHASDNQYRRMLTEAVRKYAPGLLIEHAVSQPPFTGLSDAGFKDRRAASGREQMGFSDAYRTYDVTEPFHYVCTLDRTWEVLHDLPEEGIPCKGYINGEYVDPICGVLGLSQGVMICPPAVEASLRWQRIAPPFGVRETYAMASETILHETCWFPEDLHGWIRCGQKELTESAPAVITRGCPLPEVLPLKEDVPFVFASKNPVTGAYAIGNAPRTRYDMTLYMPEADVVFPMDEPQAMGIFGEWHCVRVPFAALPGDRVWAQDLLCDEAFDITGEVLHENEIVLTRDILDRFMSRARAMMIRVIRK